MFKSKWTRPPNFSQSPELSYNKYWEHRGWNINERLKNREQVVYEKISPSAKVIDIGCGNSLLPVKLKEKGAEVEIADVSDQVLLGYQKYGISGRVLDISNLNQLRDFSGEYDYICLLEVLEHLKYPEQVIESLRKHTKYFMISVPNSATYFYRYHLLFRGRFFTQWTYHPAEHLRYWSHLDFIDWLEANGLKLKESVPVDGFKPFGSNFFIRFWPNFFAHRSVYICQTNH